MAKQMHVVVVEDEPRLRSVLVRAIAEMGMVSVGAASAPEALRLVQAGGVDLMVLDLQLPGMSGMELLTTLRNQETGRRIGVVMLTAFGDFDTARQAIHLDVAEFLTKPCSLGDLEHALEKARRRLPTELPSRAKDEPAPTEQTPAAAITAHASPSATAELSLDQLERETIIKALVRHRGHRANAAAELGISVRTLYYRLSQYGLDRQE